MYFKSKSVDELFRILIENTIINGKKVKSQNPKTERKNFDICCSFEILNPHKNYYKINECRTYSSVHDYSATKTIKKRIEKRNSVFLKKHEKRILNNSESQLETIIKKLKQIPYTRRAIINTWKLEDLKKYKPNICLNYIFCRIINKDTLEFNTHWRSRDLMNKWNVNFNEMISLSVIILEELGIDTLVYREFNDSLHIINYWNLKDILIPLLKSLGSKKNTIKKIIKRCS